MQGEIKARGPKPAETVVLARGAGDLPARHRRRRQPIRSVPQQQAEAAAGLCGKRKPTRCGEIGRIARLRQLGQNCRQGGALECLFECPERLAGVGNAQHQELSHGQTEKLAARPIGACTHVPPKVGHDAEHLPAAGTALLCGQSHNGERKPEGCTELQLACRGKLMQGRERKTPLERRIEGWHAQPQQALLGAQGGSGGRGGSGGSRGSEGRVGRR